MASVDDRVVRMRFENASFEKKVGSTLSSLGSLTSAIANVGTKNGLDTVKAADAGFSFPGVGRALEGVNAGFIAMSTIAITALSNVVNRAVDAGISLGKALSLDQVSSGFEEYELNMNSIQTILANTRKDGTNLQDVNNALDNLNEYSDKTIYNFATMTKNIGAATAAGVDLDTATTMVKGFANSAAIAGVDAGAMGGALEQMTQSLAAGVVKAQDWISLERRGLAGQVQQEAFFETAKAAGTLADVPLEKSFQEWSDEGNTLRGSLKDGWLTADVFNTTMGVFSGEMDRAALAAAGFTGPTIDEMLELGQVGIDSATKVRTLTQLVDTVKEAVASGWSVSFRTVFGDFEEASVLFTDLNDAFSGMVGESAEARNAMLQDWKDLGGRTLLIDSVKEAFQNLAAIFKPFKEAFRTIFPKKTGEDLYKMTETFSKFAKALKPQKITLDSIKLAFTGFFAAIKGVGQILGAVVKGFIAFFKAILPIGAASGPLNKVAGFIKTIGEAILNFDEGTIIDFFLKMAEYANMLPGILTEAYHAVVQFFEGLNFKGFDNIKEFFSSIAAFFGSIGGAASGVKFDTSVFDGLGSEFEKVADIGGKVADVFRTIGNAIASAWRGVSGFFGSIVDGIKGAFGGDGGGGGGGGGVNWALIGGGIAAALGGGMLAGLWKLVKAIKDFDFTGGFLTNVNNILDETRGVLKAVQADIKASALQKIAVAIGILALSLVVLSLIPAAALIKSGVAIAVLFGGLVGAMAAMEKVKFDSSDATKLTILAVALLIFAGAFSILAVAAKIIGTSGWEDLGKAGAAFGVFIGAVIALSQLMDEHEKQLIKAGITMLLMAGSMGFMAKSVRKFGTMDYEEMKQGLIGLGSSLLGFIVVFKLLPDDMEKKSLGMLGFGIALNFIVLAIKILGSMDPEQMVQGLIGIAAALTGLVIAMQGLDKINVGATAGKIMALAAAVLVMSLAVQILARMEFTSMLQGLLGMGIAMGILVGAMQLMPSGLPGAAAIFVIAGAMIVLSIAIQAFAAIAFEDFAKGMGLMVLSLAGLAGAALLLAPALPALILLGIALAAIGLGVAGIGLGIQAAAKGILLLVQVGSEGAAALEETLKAVGNAIPAFLSGVAEGFIGMAEMILEALPGLISKADESLKALLELVIDNIPGFGEVIEELIMAGLDIIETMYSDFADTGLGIIRAVIGGIEENIGPITASAINVATNFMQALGDHLPTLIETTTQTMIEVFNSLAENLGYAMGPMGVGIAVSFLKGFLQGLIDTVASIWEWVSGFATQVIDMIKSLFGIQSPATEMISIGVDIILGFLQGLVDTVGTVIGWFGDLLGVVLDAIGDTIEWLFDKGIDLLGGLLDGIVDGAKAVWNWFTNLPGEIVKKIGALLSTLKQKGKDLLEGLKRGLVEKWPTIRTWVVGMPGKILSALGSLFKTLGSQGKNLISGLYNGIINKWSTVTSWVRGIPGKIVSAIGTGFTTLNHIGRNLISGLKNGIISVWDGFSSWIWEKAKSIPGKFLDAIPIIGGPTRFTYELGQGIMMGMQMGMEKLSHLPLQEAEKSTTKIQSALKAGVDEVNAIAEAMETDIAPTIKPVIDLTQVRRDAKELTRLLPGSGTQSYAAAASIANAQAAGQASVTDHTSGNTEIKFEQTINAPTQLSTADIYRQTRNQVAMAKEALNVP